MGISAQIEDNYHASLAALAWQIDLGADEAICETPQSAYDMPDKTPWQLRSTAPAPSAPRPAVQSAKTAAVNPNAVLATAIDEAGKIAAACTDLTSLDAAAAAFDLCELRKGARGAVGGAGHPQADLLVICDPPSSDAEKAGTAMDSRDMALFDAIFRAIGRGIGAPNPEAALHLAPALPWALRGPADDRTAALAMMRPFVLRRIELVAPRVVVVMGHEALTAVLQTTGLARARGSWHALAGKARARVMQDPVGIAKTPDAKRDAWHDALAIKTALIKTPVGD